VDHLALLLGIATVQLLAAASPGPSFFVVTRYAISGRREHALAVASGILLATSLWIALAMLGVGALANRAPWLYAALQLAGAGYLIYVGAGMLLNAIRGRELALPAAGLTAGSRLRCLRDGLLTNLANPKTVAYYTSLFAVMLPAEAPAWLNVAAAATAWSVSALWWTAVATVFTFGVVQRLFRRIARWIEGLVGAALIFVGVRLACAR
jgi:threonine/homoserine/homoserine lactone efflux protein